MQGIAQEPSVESSAAVPSHALIKCRNQCKERCCSHYRMGSFCFTNTPLLLPALEESHTPKGRDLHLAQQIAASPWRRMIPASTAQLSVSGTARHSALIHGCKKTRP